MPIALVPVPVAAVADRSDDQALARSVLRGDRAAFEGLMRANNRRLFRLARATLRDDAEAEDALQDAYLQAYRTIGGFRGDSTLSTWLSRVVLNECLARLRRASRRQRIVPIVAWTEEIDIEMRNVSDDDEPDRSLMRAQMRALLERKLDALPVAFRTVFVLRSVEDLSVEETADVLSLPESTVRSRHFRARSLLRDALVQEFDVAERDAFGFDGARCDRLVAGTLARIDG